MSNVMCLQASIHPLQTENITLLGLCICVNIKHNFLNLKLFIRTCELPLCFDNLSVFHNHNPDSWERIVVLHNLTGLNLNNVLVFIFTNRRHHKLEKKKENNM
jgi:hypothetical protein